jgi:hypothetical protein
MRGKEHENDNQIRTDRKLHCFFLGPFGPLDLKPCAHCAVMESSTPAAQRKTAMFSPVNFFYSSLRKGYNSNWCRIPFDPTIMVSGGTNTSVILIPIFSFYCWFWDLGC